jgi:signal transduction histidine kinase
MSRSTSFRWRLMAALAGVSLFTLFVVGVIFYVFLGGYVLDRQEQLLLDQAMEAADQVQGVSDTAVGTGVVGGKVITALLRADLRVLPAGAGIVVFKGDEVAVRVGTTPAKDETLQRLRLEAERIAASGPASGMVKKILLAGVRRTDVLIAAAPISLGDGTTGLAVVTLARTDAVTARTGVFKALLLAGAIAIVLAILVGSGLGSWLAEPLRRLSAAAHRMAQGSYEQPVTGSYPGEVQELADSMELMRREVESSEQSLRGFVASAAHELRTPLTSIQGFSEALLDGTASTDDERTRSAAAIYRESTRLQRLVDALLTLSRYDSHEFQPTMVPVAVDALVAEEVDRLVQAGLAEPSRVSVTSEPDVRVTTDADMLRQVIANLLRNAVLYGGTAPVGARIYRQGRDLLFEVTNEGGILTEEEKARLFSRFYRGRSARQAEGFGLGLALVREICGVLGGKVELVEGGPLVRFRVTLPLDGG